MKIAFVSTMYGYIWGGSEELWSQIAHEAIKDGTSVMVSKFKFPGKEHEKLERLKSHGAQIHFRENREKRYNVINKRFYVRLLSFLNNSPKYKTEFISVFNELYQFHPDLIVLSFGYTYDYYYEKAIYDLLEKMKGVPFVIISQYHDEYSHIHQDRSSLAQVLKAAHTLYFVSRRNKEVVERQLGVNLNNAKIINNPVNLDTKTIVANQINLEKPRFACVARLDTHVKGQDILLQILGSDKWKSRNWELNLYGDGKDMQYLKDLIVFYGLEKRVSLHGQVIDIQKVWIDNDIMLFPSHAEGTPLSLMEAMICGRTAVAADVGGIEDCIIDGHTGFLADWGSVKSFDKALERAWQQKDNWQEMGKNAHDHIMNNFDMDIAATLYGEFKKTAQLNTIKSKI